MSAPYRVVSFYTSDALYTRHAEKLKAGLDALGIPYHIAECADSGSWESICAKKARFIYDQWKASDLPVVWVDVDATIEARPVLFENLETDFAIHKWDGWRFASGTIYFAQTPNAEKMLQQWVLRCEADPLTWDQVHLQSAWCDVTAMTDLKTFFLPRSYCQIFDAPQDERPVIRHWQASRQKKAKTPNVLTVDHTQSGIAARRSDKPWRTREESFWIDEGVQHIIPEVATAFPEGNYVAQALTKAIGTAYPVLEVGCGVGRLASLFAPDSYIGIDVNPHALLQARAKLPAHTFRLTDDGIAFPPAPCVFFYTVLLHLSDEALPVMLERIDRSTRRVMIAEIMDQRWRRGGNPPVFNRDPETYILEMQKLGWGLIAFDKYPYERYEKEPWNIGHDTRLTILTFEPR